MVDMQVSGRFKYWTLLLQQTNQENSDLSKREGGMEVGGRAGAKGAPLEKSERGVAGDEQKGAFEETGRISLLFRRAT
ncbi:hypothetical protein CDAR_423351 [Caerostris darwini]|uniref:Uncharacterized protein n=1 Tax=Caerostris darwini TaxID=1538125 RepID=A0AAV4THN6_9ARAC|nr:hypothetical protein CDAR_423351 [Caerostris darwini]